MRKGDVYAEEQRPRLHRYVRPSEPHLTRLKTLRGPFVRCGRGLANVRVFPTGTSWAVGH